MAEEYSKIFKEDGFMCKSSHRSFTFDKGKNSLNDKVVIIREESEYEFLGLKKSVRSFYAEFYNRFIDLVSFKTFYDKRLTDRSVTNDNVFFDDSRVRYCPLRFDKVGGTDYVGIKKTYTDGKYLTRLFFHSAWPTKEQVFEFKVPNWLTVDFKKMNFEGYKIEMQETKKSGYTNYVFIMRDIPAFRNEFARIGRSYTDPHIIFQIRTYRSNGEELKGFDEISDVYSWNNRLYKMAGNEKNNLSSQLAKITAGKTSDIDKIKAIYYWVQDNIRYIAYEEGLSGYIPASAKDVLDKKYGDCKGMANLLTELLKLAGYDAHFSWIGTRELPYKQNLPALCVNNHAICTLYFGGKTYYLDGTESYVPFGENAFRIQGKEVMISKGEKYEINAVPSSTASDNKVVTHADFILSNEKLNGKIKVYLSGERRTEFHQHYQNLPITSQQDFLSDFLEFGNDNLVATNIKTSDLKNRELPIELSGDLDLSNTINVINNDMYVGIDFFPKTLDRYIPDEKRVEGYDLDVLIKYEDKISLTLPAEKKFFDKPDNLELKFDGYEFRGIYSLEGNRMTLTKELSIKNSVIKKSDLANWMSFVKSIKDFNKYLISITKK